MYRHSRSLSYQTHSINNLSAGENLTNNLSLNAPNYSRFGQKSNDSSEDLSTLSDPVPSQMERNKKAFDHPHYRSSLDSISECKTRNTFLSLHPSRERVSSFESSSVSYSSKDYDYLPHEFENIQESVTPSNNCVGHSGFGTVDLLDNVAGEWNNFWLNYNNARNNQIPSPFVCDSAVKTVDEFTDTGSIASVHNERLRKNSDEIVLSRVEIMETIRYCKKITEILQNALQRNENMNELQPDVYINAEEEEEEMGVEPLFYFKQKQKQMPKSNNSQSTTSGLNTFLTSGVADILKKVIHKRKDSDGTIRTKSPE